MDDTEKVNAASLDTLDDFSEKDEPIQFQGNSTLSSVENSLEVLSINSFQESGSESYNPVTNPDTNNSPDLLLQQVAVYPSIQDVNPYFCYQQQQMPNQTQTQFYYPQQPMVAYGGTHIYYPQQPMTNQTGTTFYHQQQPMFNSAATQFYHHQQQPVENEVAGQLHYQQQAMVTEVSNRFQSNVPTSMPFSPAQAFPLIFPGESAPPNVASNQRGYNLFFNGTSSIYFPGIAGAEGWLYTPQKPLCKYFLEGYCMYGERCRYVHPVAAQPMSSPSPLAAQPLSSPSPVAAQPMSSPCPVAAQPTSSLAAAQPISSPQPNVQNP